MVFRFAKISFFLGLLIPLLAIVVGAFHAHPNAEDLSLTAGIKNHSIIHETIKLLAKYDGRYFTNILHGLNVLAIGKPHWYSWNLLSTIFFFLFSFTYFFKSIFQNLSWFKSLIAAILIFILSIIQSSSLPHEFYWLVSSYVYLYPWIFLTLFISLYLRSINNKQTWKKTLYFNMSLLVFFLFIGINEMFLVITVFIILCITYYNFNNKFNFFNDTLPLILVGVVGISLFMTSPGISERYNSFETPKDFLEYPKLMLIMMEHFLFEFYQQFLRNPFFHGMLASFILFINDKKDWKIKLDVITVNFFILFGFLAVFLMTTPYYFTLAKTESIFPDRIFTSVGTGLVLWMFFVIIVVCQKISLTNVFIKKMVAVFSIVSIIVGLVTNENLKLLITEYKDGTLKNYDLLMKKRFEKLALERQNEFLAREIELMPISKPPKSIYYPPDIVPNRAQEYWNEAYERYFYLNEVYLKGDTLRKHHFLKNALNDKSINIYKNQKINIE